MSPQNSSGGKGSIPSCCVPEARKAARPRERGSSKTYFNLNCPRVPSQNTATHGPTAARMGTQLGIAETGKEGGRGLRICVFTAPSSVRVHREAEEWEEKVTPPLLYIGWKLFLLVPRPSEVAFSRSNWEKTVLPLYQVAITRQISVSGSFCIPMRWEDQD